MTAVSHTLVHGAIIADAAGLHASRVRRLGRSGYLAIGVFVATVGGWMATASLSGAVIAPAFFVVENNVKKVQHANGGIVSDLMVREGDAVHAGDVLLRLDQTIARTNLQIISRQLDEARAGGARLMGERDMAARPAFPIELTARAEEPGIQSLMAAELRLFDARAKARQGMRAQLAKRISQLRSEITGLAGQLSAKASEQTLNARELENVRGLFKRNLVPTSRLAQLERDAVSLEGFRSQLAAQIAQSEGKIAEIELQILQIDEEHRGEVLRDLRENQARILELTERRAAADDQFRRTEVRAPASGIVHQLAVHNSGGVINAGEPVMLIVPSEEQLHLEARINPADYDQVQLGQDVVVRIHAFNQRTTPELFGSVSRVSADVSRETQSGAPYYVIRIALPRTEIERVAPMQIKAGMQAEAFVRTIDRSPSSFLLKPLSDQFARAFRER